MAPLVKPTPDTPVAGSSFVEITGETNPINLKLYAHQPPDANTLSQLQSSPDSLCVVRLRNKDSDVGRVPESHARVLRLVWPQYRRWCELDIRATNARSLRNDYLLPLTKVKAELPHLAVLRIFGSQDGHDDLPADYFPDILVHGAPKLKRARFHGCGYRLAKGLTFASLHQLAITGVPVSIADLYILPTAAPNLNRLIVGGLEDRDRGQHLPSSLKFPVLTTLCIYHGDGSTVLLSLVSAPLTNLQIPDVPLYSSSVLKDYAEALGGRNVSRFPRLLSLWLGNEDNCTGFSHHGDYDQSCLQLQTILLGFPILEDLAFVGRHVNCCTSYINNFCLEDKAADMLFPKLKSIAVIRFLDPRVEHSDDYVRATLRFVEERLKFSHPLKNVQFIDEDCTVEVIVASCATLRPWKRPANEHQRAWTPEDWSWVCPWRDFTWDYDRV